MTTQLIEWAVASRPLESDESGDAYLVRPWRDGALLGVVDGLGHGHDAARASREAIRLLAEAGADDPVTALRICHEGLRETRGVVIALGWIDGAADRLTWVSVGNVQSVLVRCSGDHSSRREMLIGPGGVVGRRLPSAHPSMVMISPGDLLVLATDGIHPGFVEQIPRFDPPQRVADSIMATCRTGADDALVLTIRYRGPGA